MYKPVLLALAVIATAAQAAPAACASAAHTQGSHARTPHGGRVRASLADWEFMRKAAALGQALLAEGKLARGDGHAEAARALGSSLVREQAPIRQELSLLSLVKQVPLPSRPARSERRLLEQWKKLPETAFDSALRKHVGDLRQQMRVLFEQETRSAAADPALCTLAARNLPALQSSLD